MLGRGTQMAHDSHPHEGRRYGLPHYTTDIAPEYDPNRKQYWRTVQRGAGGVTDKVCTVNPVAFTSLIVRAENRVRQDPSLVIPFDDMVRLASQALTERQPVLEVPSTALRALVKFSFANNQSTSASSGITAGISDDPRHDNSPRIVAA
jgi:hypothetical protein